MNKLTSHPCTFVLSDCVYDESKKTENKGSADPNKSREDIECSGRHTDGNSLKEEEYENGEGKETYRIPHIEGSDTCYDHSVD